MAFDINRIRNFILDMDGVLWRGETPFPGLEAFFQTLHQLDLNFVLATNNATKVADQYMEKLARFGVTAAPEQILTSAEATADYLRDHYASGTTVYVVGETGLQQAIRSRGFELLDAEGFVGGDARVELVVVGFNRHVCYPQLASAAHLVHNGARFIGTNPDLTFPHEVGPLPGAGSLLALIQAATGVEPFIVGKPSPAIFKEAMERMGGTPENTVMVGDRLETDIKGAQAAGLYTILLLSGVTTLEKASSHEIQPDLICENISELARLLTG